MFDLSLSFSDILKNDLREKMVLKVTFSLISQLILQLFQYRISSTLWNVLDLYSNL